MVFIKASAVFSLITAIAAAPVGTPMETALTLDAVKPVPNSSVPWNNGAINANNNKLWIGKKSQVECIQNQPCPQPEKAQMVLYNTQKTLSLKVGVLGDQQIFVDKSGALVYLIPRDPLPEVAYGADAWGLTETPNKGDVANVYNQQVLVWYACPETAAAKTQGPWQIFAETRQHLVANQDVPSGNKNDCTIFGLQTQFSTPLWYNNGN
ncbi:hypothetical protein ABW21_db0203387 [Orbilia brochopaga]|nr:hypothetical protein ABW21_db0203387 [Drechslerella brochopaga]